MIPTLALPDGTSLYDSRVISEYLDSQYRGGLYPVDGPVRWHSLSVQSLSDGILEAAVRWLCEETADPSIAKPKVAAASLLRIDAALDVVESDAEFLSATPFNIGHVALACACAYLDFRVTTLNWRQSRPHLTEWMKDTSRRRSVEATAFVDIY